MHDIRMIRDDPDGFDAAMARRGLEPVAAGILSLDEKFRALTTKLQEMQSRRNEASKAIGQAMGQGDKDKAEALKAEVSELKQSMPQIEEEERALGEELRAALLGLPNLLDPSVPDGDSEDDNVFLREWGEKPSFDFEPKEHADIAPALGMDFETGAKISGARFTFLRGDIARLHRALGQFMLDTNTREHGYTECNPPLLIREEAGYGTGQLPKFSEDLFQTTDGRYLISTSEMSLGNSFREQIFEEADFPMRITALTPCFRSEAGAAGKDTRGFIRQHQFEKVELISAALPEQSEAEQERITSIAEGLLQALGLHYRVVALCSGDMGAAMMKTFDLEVWLPGQGAYREISSCSNGGAYQPRRMNARYRPKDSKKTEYFHLLNGSGLAVGRTLVAIIENYQQADGSVAIPKVLHPYMGGVTKLEPLG
ncbi:serine--tRNA ligase [Altererythrobacter lutimaris]|uniref:Serine--tRNA ligase n=1 Tax=Altererythrobacter lutimaris TaxID=2743979 RepID=A0A850H6G2_9SPHN|nr:serine--tRNA ligase [Altererythrobacter lutimaris]NVE94834.1 serine--tRNA ligase [Altererythrobacter lutimaris]